MGRRRRSAGALTAAVLLGTGLVAVAGCGPSPSSCLPAALSVTPSIVAPGDSLTISSPPVDCTIAGNYRDYTIDLATGMDDSSTDSSPTEGVAPTDPPVDRLGTLSVGKDGAFSTQVRVPDDARPGAANVSISGSAHDYCPGSNVDCAGYTAHLTITSADAAG